MATGKVRYHVYVVLLDPAVMRHRRFVDQNPNLATYPICLYVGMTRSHAEARLAVERRSEGYAVWQR